MKNLFKFIEDRYPEYPTPLKWKLLNEPDSITEKDLNVKGNLNLNYTKITQLPDNLNIEGSLWLEGSSLPKLPNNLKVGGFLNIEDTPITQLPDNLKVGTHLWLAYTKITQLPNNLKVGGNLGLSNTPLAKKYSEDQIEQMIEDKGGYIKEGIIT